MVLTAAATGGVVMACGPGTPATTPTTAAASPTTTAPERSTSTTAPDRLEKDTVSLEKVPGLNLVEPTGEAPEEYMKQLDHNMNEIINGYTGDNGADLENASRT